MRDARHLYLLALGSNRPLSSTQTPTRLIEAAVRETAQRAGSVLAVAPILRTAPLGPSRRRFANSAMLLASDLAPLALLRCLQDIESHLGRQRRLRWGERRVDIDIILWSGGSLRRRTLQIPHRAFRDRTFVLRPALAIAPRWRDPATGFTMRQLEARLRKSSMVDRTGSRH